MGKIRENTLNLKEEVKLLRSFVIGTAGKDPEGEYRSEYVEKVLQALKEKPEYKFRCYPS